MGATEDTMEKIKKEVERNGMKKLVDRIDAHFKAWEDMHYTSWEDIKGEFDFCVIPVVGGKYGK